jgi:hypothetical protein
MAWIKPSVSEPRRAGHRAANVPRSVSVPRPSEDDATLSFRQRNGIDALVDLLQRRRYIHRRAELIQWRSEFAEVVKAMRAEQGTSGIR